MEITFKVKETMEQIVNAVYNGVFYESRPQKEKSPGGWDIVHFKDRDHDCEAIAWVCPDRETIEIETFWSKFRYTIWQRGSQVFVRYNGAFNGLLAQNLIPKLTPVDLENEVVTTSLKSGHPKPITYKEYKEIHRKLQEFKSTL